MVVDSLPTLISGERVNVQSNKSLLSKNTKGILILDDNTLLMRNLQVMLEVIGYNVFTTTSEFEGINIFNRNREKINLLLIDSIKSDVTGLELFSIFKTLNPDIRILVIVHEDMDLTFWENLQIDSFIVEPIQLNSLINALDQILY